MSAIGGPMWRREDDAARPHERAHERSPRRTTDAGAPGAPLPRRVAFPEGAHALLGVSPLTMIATTPPLPRTAALAPGGYMASLVSVASPRQPATVATVATVATLGAPARAQAQGCARRALWYQAALYVSLNLGDVVSTYLGLRHGLSEGNPLMGTLLTHDGFGALIVYKIAITLAVLAGLWLLSAWNVRATRVALLISNTLVALVVILNFVQFALLGR